MLVNLHESNVLGEDENRTLAGLFIGYMWQHFLTLPKKTDFYVIIDEFQMFATERVASIMDQSAKFGLHLMVFHQREGKMSKNLIESMTNASAKIVFIGERRFTLNGREVNAPHVPDLENNPALDEATTRYVSSLLPENEPEPIIEEKPVDRKPMPQPTSDLELIELYRYLTGQQLAILTNDTSQKQQNTRKRLGRLVEQEKLKTVKHDGKNVYCLPNDPEKHLGHELLITETHLAVRDHLAMWRQMGLKDDINPDAFFCLKECFYLEIENSNARSDGENSLVTKARGYAKYSDEQRHKPFCDNFRVPLPDAFGDQSGKPRPAHCRIRHS